MKKTKEPSMSRGGVAPLATVHVNGTYILGIYQGKLSEYDIVLRYRQNENGKWSRIRTPKHIHWAVDMMIKHYSEPHETDSLLDSLIEQWQSTAPIESQNDKNALLNEQALLDEVNSEATQYPKLADKGEYSVKFLILIAKLLMVQEKTNRHDAYMFKKLLERLKEHRNIFEIVSTATFH